MQDFSQEKEQEMDLFLEITEPFSLAFCAGLIIASTIISGLITAFDRQPECQVKSANAVEILKNK